MCKRHSSNNPEVSFEGPYEGNTTRLSTERGSCGGWGWKGRHGSFPWWTLWLLWPLIALIKGVGTAFFGTVAASWVALGAFAIPANLLLALGLIVIGGALVLRRR